MRSCQTLCRWTLPSECVTVVKHSSRTPWVAVWGAISYHRQSNSLQIEGNLNSNRCVREVLQLEIVPCFQSIPGATFQQENARVLVAKITQTSVQPNACNFFFRLLIRQICRLFSTCGICLVGVFLVIRVLLLQNTNLVCAYKQYEIFYHKQTFKICLTPCDVV